MNYQDEQTLFSDNSHPLASGSDPDFTDRNEEQRCALPLSWRQWKEAKVKSLSHVQLFATPWTVAYHAPPSMGFSRQESWSGLSFPSPGDLPDPGIKPRSPTLQADALTSEPPGKSVPNSCSRLHNDLRQSYNSATLDLRFWKFTSWGSPGQLVKNRFPRYCDSASWGWGSTICISNKGRGHADTAGPVSTLW